MNLKGTLKVEIVIPTLNAERSIEGLLKSIREQKGIIAKVIIIDSDSNDKTIYIARRFGCEIIRINRLAFNHGGTRQVGVDSSEGDILVFLTQDVILVNELTIRKLLECFNEIDVGCAYGRQLPKKDANIWAAHAREFNYSNKSKLKCISDIDCLGIKTAFISNSFAAYRKKALEDVGGFPNDVILSEDTYVAAKMLLKGWKNYYCAESLVYHSHNYTIKEEIKRYFDLGVFHTRNKWIRRKFGKNEGEGRRFAISEIKYLNIRRKKYLIFISITRNVMKYIGYKMGECEKNIPLSIKRKISMCSFFWN